MEEIALWGVCLCIGLPVAGIALGIFIQLGNEGIRRGLRSNAKRRKK
jgi:hypothetical protein